MRKAKLCVEELHLLTAIPLGALENFTTGRFKPAQNDREILTVLSRQVDGKTSYFLRCFIQRAKFRLLAPFISAEEKAGLLSHEKKDYEESLDLLIQKYGSSIEETLAERYKEKSA